MPVPKLRRAASLRVRFGETFPGALSWAIISAPVWLTILDPGLAFTLVSASVVYFLSRAMIIGIRGLLNHRRVLMAASEDWLAKLEREGDRLGVDWRDCRITLLIRAYREDNVQMLRDTLAAIERSNWPRQGGMLSAVEVVFATEEHDPITPPLVELLAVEFRERLAIRQFRHPEEPGTLPGPSTAMHYVGRILYREAILGGIQPHLWLIADFDCDTIVHPQYLPCLIHHFAAEANRQKRVYQPVVAFTNDYWQAPLHSRLSAMGTTALTVSWNRSPEVAFSGAAASLALLRSVDFWPTSSHSQDSGLDLRLRMRHGRHYRVVGLPVPVRVYPVMVVQRGAWRLAAARGYLESFRTLFRQSARWREGPLDEFAEATRRSHLFLMLHRLWHGLERDTMSLLPGYGYLVTGLVSTRMHPAWSPGLGSGESQLLGLAMTIALSIASLLGVAVFWLLLSAKGQLVRQATHRRRIGELVSFWLVLGLYLPVITGIAGLKTATLYALGKRPRGHFTPTPK